MLTLDVSVSIVLAFSFQILTCGCGLQMITHSKALPVVLLIDMFALLSYNFAGMCVTGETLCFAEVSACPPAAGG